VRQPLYSAAAVAVTVPRLAHATVQDARMMAPPVLSHLLAAENATADGRGFPRADENLSIRLSELTTAGMDGDDVPKHR
jgi:hypothetical protein